MRWIVGGVVAAILLYAVSPYWTLLRLGHAMRAGDITTMDEVFDWPKIREGIKADVIASQSEMPDSNPWAALGQALGMSMIDGMLPRIASSQNILKMIDGPKPAFPFFTSLSQTITAGRWTGATTFEVTNRETELQNPTSPNYSKLLMRFDFPSWRIVRFTSTPFAQLSSHKKRDRR